MAIIPACHAGDPSSILGCGGLFYFYLKINKMWMFFLLSNTIKINMYNRLSFEDKLSQKYLQKNLIEIQLRKSLFP